MGVSLVSLKTNARLFANPSVVAMFGYESASQFLAVPIEQTYADPADYMRVRDMTAEERLYPEEVRRRRSDGSTWWRRVDRKVIEFEGEACLMIWYHDITDSKATDERFCSFVSSGADWYWEMDENLRFVYFSDRFFEVTGVAPEALLGKTREET